MEIGTRMLGLVLKILSFLTAPVNYIISFRTQKKLPPITDPILKQSATSLARRIRNGEITSEQVVTAFINRIEQVNSQLNAVVEQRYSAALDEARAVDQLIASRRKTPEQLETETPFLGVPISIKESCGLKGMSHTTGSVSRTGVKALESGQGVANMLKTGAIPIAVTTTPELCLSWETNNLVTGLTKNPYDQNRTSGGSSGGEGALLGSAASVFGVGSDIAGSIRLPALYNGIFGHKPSPGAVPTIGHYPYLEDPNFDKFIGVGPMARYAEDLKPMLVALAGEYAPKLRLNEKVNMKDLKVFYKDDAGYSTVMVPVDTDIKAILHKAVQYLKDTHGSTIQKAVIPELENSVEISCAVFFRLTGVPNLLIKEDNPKEQKNMYVEIIKAMFGCSKISIFTLGFYWLWGVNAFVPKSKSEDYYQQCQELQKKFIDLLKDDGVFVYPTHPTPALFHNQSLTKTAGVLYTMLFNVLGLPATHVPLGLNQDGLPIGIQVVAAPNQDRLCLAVAEELEKQFGGWVPPPST